MMRYFFILYLLCTIPDVLSSHKIEMLGVTSSLIKSKNKFSVETYSKTQAKAKLKQAFEQNKPIIIQISDRKPAAKMLAFDWDGVITEEKGYYEKAWAVLMHMMETHSSVPSLDLSVTQFEQAAQFRAQTRGENYAQRFAALRKKYKVQSGEFNDETCLQIFYGAVFEWAKAEFQGDLNQWVFPDSMDFLNFAHRHYPHLPLYIISANIEGPIQELARSLTIGQLFTDVFGHPLLTSEETPRDKTVILKELMDTYDFKPHEVIFFGDAKSDIRFGQRAGVITVGIANSVEEGIGLIDEGANFIITRPLLKAPLFKILGGLSKETTVAISL